MSHGNPPPGRLPDLHAFVERHFDEPIHWHAGDEGADVICPGHNDHTPSLSVGLGDENDRLVVHCHAGCDTEGDVLPALRLTWRNLFFDHRERPRPDRPWPRAEVTIAHVEGAYTAYQGDDDLAMLHAVLAAAASHELPDDPLWLAVVGAPSSGKTEVLNGLLGLPDVHAASKLSPAAFLSASPRRERNSASTGGLLRIVGESGLVVFKDFTTMLSESREAQAEVLAMLREVHDGRVDRYTGVDGGQTQTWRGKATAILACTESLDDAHSVRATMGERFVMIRQGVGAGNGQRRGSARRAMRNGEQSKALRDALHTAMQRFLSGDRVRHGHGQFALTAEVEDRLADLATLVSRARSGVNRDRYRREIESVPEAEFPARLAKQLAKVWRAGGVIGLEAERAWALVCRVAFDSMPLLRWRCLDTLLQTEGTRTSAEVEHAVTKPRRTVLRALEDLAALGVIEQTGGFSAGAAATWRVGEEYRAMARAVDPLNQTVPAIHPSCVMGEVEGEGDDRGDKGSCQIAGTVGSRSDQRSRRGDPEPPVLTTVTGCSVEEWMAGVKRGFPDGLRLGQLDQLADYCDECTGPERTWNPKALGEEPLTAYYVCREGHAWVSTFASLDLLWEVAA